MRSAAVRLDSPFVLWWDEEEKNPGNRGAGRGNIRPSQTTDALKAEDYGVDRDTIHRWRPFLGVQLSQ